MPSGNQITALGARVSTLFRAASCALALAAAFSLLATPFPSVAAAQITKADEEQALEFTKSLSERAFAVLRDASISPRERDLEFRRLLRDGVAVDVVGNLLLGHYRKVMNREQYDRYHEVFPDFLIKRYTDNILEIGDERVVFESTTPFKTRTVFVRTRLESADGARIANADWRIQKMGEGDFKVIDVAIEGISLARTIRDQFRHQIQRDGFDVFIDSIAKEAAQVSYRG
ncbi:MAG: ABC transporter substrate-binding protein [Pseudomonadota bacterium]